MVVLNNVLPVNYNKMNKIVLKESINKITNIIEDIFYNDKNKIKYRDLITKRFNEELKDIYDSNHNIYLFMNNRYCVHRYKRGIREGHVCGAKIEINSYDYLCSRHNRDYKTNNRVYTNNNIRCNYIRNNNQQCKHRCSEHNSYCYIHLKNIEIYKKNNLEKLKKMRINYFKNKSKYNYKYVKKYKKKLNNLDENTKTNTMYNNYYNYMYRKDGKRFFHKLYKHIYMLNTYDIT